MSTSAVPEPVLVALRDRRLRRHHAGAVYAELWGSLSYDEPRVAKIRQTAQLLRIHRSTMRRALLRLVDSDYLRFSHRDGKGRAYYQKIDGTKGGYMVPPLAVRTAAAA